jgi:hypothetical protein
LSGRNNYKQRVVACGNRRKLFLLQSALKKHNTRQRLRTSFSIFCDHIQIPPEKHENALMYINIRRAAMFHISIIGASYSLLKTGLRKLHKVQRLHTSFSIFVITDKILHEKSPKLGWGFAVNMVKPLGGVGAFGTNQVGVLFSAQ